MKNLLFLSFLLWNLMACNTSDDVTTEEETTTMAQVDELVFGLYYGRCAGDCTHFFKLSEGAMFKDQIEGRFDGRDWDNFNTEAAPTDEYELAVGLMESIPDALLGSAEEKFGNPNVADQGTYFVVAQKDGEQLGPWQIDPFAAEVGEELQEFHAELSRVINTLVN